MIKILNVKSHPFNRRGIFLVKVLDTSEHVNKLIIEVAGGVVMATVVELRQF